MKIFILANNPRYKSTEWKNKTHDEDLIICLNKISNKHFPIFRGCTNNLDKIKKCDHSAIKYGIALPSKNCEYWLKKKCVKPTHCSIKIGCDEKILKLISGSNKKPIKPSTGFIAACYYSTKYPNNQIYLVGFTFSGSVIHNWKVEKDWCNKKENIAIL